MTDELPAASPAAVADPGRTTPPATPAGDDTAGRALAEQLRRRVEARREHWVERLVELVEAESPSHDAAAQGPVLDLLAESLGELGFRRRRLSGEASGGMLLAMPAERRRGVGFQLLLGHGDTVWPVGTLATMPVRRETVAGRDGEEAGEILRGPGVYDMKGGLVQALAALDALAACDVEVPRTPVLLVTTDEEIGSRESRATIERLARRACRVFVLEPALGPEGRLKTARKGVGHFVLRVTGRAAHAGLDPEQGVSAILELSHLVQTLFALNDAERGTTVNVGTIDGGLRANVVAPESTAAVDVRVLERAEAQRVEAAIRSLEPTLPGTRLEVEGGFGRPPMPRQPRHRPLWRQARRRAAWLGLELEEGTAGGGSDGNFTARLAPTLDGLGAVGGGAHAEHEHLRLDHFASRAALLALLLAAPAEGTSGTTVRGEEGSE